MILKLKRTPGIYLVGFMGCGKSTVGQALAEELGWKFVDLDHEIETREGLPIAEIFETRGEPAFREIEARVLKELVRAVEGGRPHIVALGGGTFHNEVNSSLLANNGVTIWLDCPLEVVKQRVAGFVHRPLAREPEKFQSLFETRRPGYGRADYHLALDDERPDAVVARILALNLL